MRGPALNKAAFGETQYLYGASGGDGGGESEGLYRSRYEHFVRVAIGVVGDAEGGRDAVQSAFVAAVRRRSSFRGSGPLEAWLWRIVVSEASRLRRERVVTLDHVGEPTTNGHARDDLGLRAGTRRSPDGAHGALSALYADLDYRTIADMLGIEVGTVSATLSAAHTTLRRALRGGRTIIESSSRPSRIGPAHLAHAHA